MSKDSIGTSFVFLVLIDSNLLSDSYTVYGGDHIVSHMNGAKTTNDNSLFGTNNYTERPIFHKSTASILCKLRNILSLDKPNNITCNKAIYNRDVASVLSHLNRRNINWFAYWSNLLWWWS